MGAAYLEEKLKDTYQTYYTTKGQAHLLRKNYLHTLAEAWAEKGQANKERVYKQLLHVEQQRATATHKQLLHVEQQRATATRIKYIREKLKCDSTTSVKVRDSTGHWQEISDKGAMEEAIMAGTKTKYTAAFGTPFMVPPLVIELGYLGKGRAADEVLQGVYTIPPSTDQYTADFIRHLQQPQVIQENRDYPTEMPIETYRNYWRKAKERTSCYPGVLSFATLKAGAQDACITEFECIMMRGPLFAGYTPKNWKLCLDVMLLKKAGTTQVDALRMIMLFQPDCNYAFKFVG